VATTFLGVFMLLSVIGFLWMLKLMGVHSFEYLTDLDYSNSTNVAIGGGCAALFMYFLYMINFPEGQLARDAPADEAAWTYGPNSVWGNSLRAETYAPKGKAD